MTRTRIVLTSGMRADPLIAAESGGIMKALDDQEHEDVVLDHLRRSLREPIEIEGTPLQTTQLLLALSRMRDDLERRSTDERT